MHTSKRRNVSPLTKRLCWIMLAMLKKISKGLEQNVSGT